jgi:hypothetical protein
MAYTPLALVDKSIWDFDPRIIPGCVLWLDGADTYTQFQNTAATTPITATSQSINAWKDKSLSALTFTTTGVGSNVTAPSSAFNSQNGLPTVSFQATGFPTATAGQGLITTTNVSRLPTAATSGTYFAVTMATAQYSLPQVFFTYGSSTSAAFTTRQFYYGDNPTYPGTLHTDIYTQGRISDGTDYRTNYSILSNTMTTINSGFDNGEAFSGGQFTDGASLASMNVGTGRASVGYGLDSSTNKWWLNGNIAEILVFSNVLTTTERQQVEGYLAWKWGLQANLVSGHPYKDTVSGVVRPFLRAFQPTDLPTPCMLWFDGGDATTLTLSGSNVTAWRDKSGNANNINSFSSTQPVYNESTSLLTFSGGTGTTSSSIALSSTTSYSIFYVITFMTGLTDTGSLVFARPFQLSGTPLFFVGTNRGGYTVTVSGATISGSNTTYNVTNTSGLTTGNTVTIAGITLGAATGYNGTGVVQSFVTNTSITVNITSTGTPTSFTGATARNGTSNVNYYVEGNAGSGPFFFFATSQGFNTYSGTTFIVSLSQTGATTYTLSVNGNASAQTAATATMANRQVVIGFGTSGTSFGLGEVLMYNGALSTQNRQRVEGYLAWKWGAQRTSNTGASTNLPTLHPMYNFPSATVTP